MRPSTEQEALSAGYTRSIVASSECFDLELLVQPDANLDGTFKAFDRDSLEMLNVNGWLFVTQDAGL